MKRSEINQAIRDASDCFKRHGWTLPPKPRWDVTDFGKNNFTKYGLVLVNLAEEPEYCEKLMFAYQGQQAPAHTHRVKKEDIICRQGSLELRLWPATAVRQGPAQRGTVTVAVDGEPRTIVAGQALRLEAGSRVTLCPGTYHEFWPAAEDTILGEVSTSNDDVNDNIFAEPIARFARIEEDEPPIARLVSDLA